MFYTPEQTKQLIQIMSKHGQTGWLIEFHDPAAESWKHTNKPSWNWGDVIYRAVGPRKRVELKYGMVVKNNSGGPYGLVTLEAAHGEVAVVEDGMLHYEEVKNFTHYRWPNGDGTWLAIEGEPEIISL